MPAYVLVQVRVTDPKAYDDYKKLAQAAVEQYDGRYIVRGGEAEDVEGARPYPRVVVLEFPDMDAARTWYRSPEYHAAKAARKDAGEGVFTILEGVS